MSALLIWAADSPRLAQAHGGPDDQRTWVCGLPSSFSLGAGDALLISSVTIVSEGGWRIGGKVCCKDDWNSLQARRK